MFGLHQLRHQWTKSKIFVIAFTSDIGRYSNKFDRLYYAHSSEDLKNKALQAYKEIGGGEVYAFVFANRMLEYLMNGNEDLFKLLHFENTFHTYQQIVDKTLADQLCRNLGIVRPVEYALEDETTVNSIKYPVVIKPLEKFTAKGASKCEFIADKKQLDLYLCKLKKLDIAFSNLVCQQMVRGDNRWEYGYGGFFRDGEPMVDVCFHQFRQYPQGLSCYAREVTDEIVAKQLKSISSLFLKHLKYNGFIEFDIKQDCVSGEFVVLDINPRPWGSSDMLRVKLGNSTVFSPKLNSYKVVWRKPVEEIVASHNKSNPSYSACKQITGTSGFKTAIALWYLSDMKPFLKNTREELANIKKN